MKKYILPTMFLIIVILINFNPTSSPEKKTNKSIKRSMASITPKSKDPMLNKTIYLKSAENDESTFKKDYQGKQTLDIGSDQTLILSGNTVSLPIEQFSPEMGEKVLDFSGFVEFKPRHPSTHHLPVVFNTLYQKKGYLTGKLTLFYDDEFNLNNMINEIESNEMKVIIKDEDLKMLHVSYQSTETLGRVLKQYEKSEVDIFYFPIIAD